MAGRRQFNMNRAKGIVMLVLGAFVAVGSGFTGIGAQAALDPMLRFLLGFGPGKANALALVFAMLAAAAGAVGAARYGVALPLGLALGLTVAATMGILVAARLARNGVPTAAVRAAHGAVILLCIYVIAQSVRPRIGGPLPVPLPLLQTGAGLAISGLLAGALSALFRIPIGVLLVPGLVYLNGREPIPAIATALCVVVLASLLPTLAYVARNAVDERISGWMLIGAALGGAAGGALLGRMTGGADTLPLVAFGLVAMFLSARTLSGAVEDPAAPAA